METQRTLLGTRGQRRPGDLFAEGGIVRLETSDVWEMLSMWGD
jgi:hypothetical protein